MALFYSLSVDFELQFLHTDSHSSTCSKVPRYFPSLIMKTLLSCLHCKMCHFVRQSHENGNKIDDGVVPNQSQGKTCWQFNPQKVEESLWAYLLLSMVRFEGLELEVVGPCCLRIWESKEKNHIIGRCIPKVLGNRRVWKLMIAYNKRKRKTTFCRNPSAVFALSKVIFKRKGK